MSIVEIMMEGSGKDKEHGTSLLAQRLAGAHIDSVAEQICENDQFVCMGGDVFSPFDMYVTLKQNWNMLEHAQRIMQEYYIEGKPGLGRTQPEVSKKYLIPGDFVAYNYKNEWHRGKIMEIAKGGCECQVKLIDYGGTYHEETKKLKVLHRSHYTLMAQAIHCELDFATKEARVLQQLDVERSKLVSMALRNLMRSRDLLVVFKELSLEGEGLIREVRWKVDMYVVDRNEKNDLILHLEEGGSVQKQLLRNLRIANLIPPV